MDRRSLLQHTGLAGAMAAGVAPAVHAQATLRWRIVSSFPRSLDTIYGGAEVFANAVRKLSNGKFDIAVHAGGDLVPAFGVVDSVQSGAVEMCHTVPYYFYDKHPAFALGSAIPFGFNARQMTAWMVQGNGRKLMDEFYAGSGHARAGTGSGPQGAGRRARRQAASGASHVIAAARPMGSISTSSSPPQPISINTSRPDSAL